ncbi:nitrate ABC transporter permease [Paenibacillus selenitireducens]|uniref:Nitrate ABC transporter permease n=1 Tax=Paenibacillus selenitireducens TaxID=1324314 RepID=A0A1T2XJU8_9BACL|nr:ABC transporter permease [Paenibacillus selenitireducens]OPA80124.1 nitrate ABC transporter permease [Paenibacillus selenitireducens]
MRKKSWFQLGWPPVAVLLSFLVIWQCAVSIGHIEEWLLPSPLRILETFTLPEVYNRLWMHAMATVRITTLGLAAGIGLGVVLAVLLHLVPFLKRGVYPLLILTQNVPVVTTGPLLVIWLGYGISPKVVLIMLVCFFPIVVSTLTGLTQPDAQYMNYLQMIGATKRQILWKLELPNALPYLFSGMKLAASYSVITAVTAEWLGAKDGLGIYIKLSGNGFMTARVFAAIVVIVAFSLILFGIFSLLERFAIRWKPKKGA